MPPERESATQIPRHPAKYFSPKIQRLHTERARFRQPSLRDFTGCVASEIRMIRAHRRVQKFMNPAETPTRNNLFVGDMSQLRFQVTKKLNLTFCAWRKIRLPSFGLRYLILATIPEENSFSQPGSRRNHANRPMMRGSSWIRGTKSFAPASPDSSSGGEVVQ